MNYNTDAINKKIAELVGWKPKMLCMHPIYLGMHPVNCCGDECAIKSFAEPIDCCGHLKSEGEPPDYWHSADAALEAAWKAGVCCILTTPQSDGRYFVTLHTTRDTSLFGDTPSEAICHCLLVLYDVGLAQYQIKEGGAHEPS